MTLTARIGRFFLFAGFVLLVLFFASDLANAPRFNLFFIGLAGIVVGILMLRRGRIPQEPSGRFRILHSLRSGKNKKKKDKPQTEEGESSAA